VEAEDRARGILEWRVEQGWSGLYCCFCRKWVDDKHLVSKEHLRRREYYTEDEEASTRAAAQTTSSSRMVEAAAQTTSSSSASGVDSRSAAAFDSRLEDSSSVISAPSASASSSTAVSRTRHRGNRGFMAALRDATSQGGGRVHQEGFGHAAAAGAHLRAAVAANVEATASILRSNVTARRTENPDSDEEAAPEAEERQEPEALDDLALGEKVWHRSREDYATVVKIDRMNEPPTYSVKMAFDGREVGVERAALQKLPPRGETQQVIGPSRVVCNYPPRYRDRGYLALARGQEVHVTYIGSVQSSDAGWLFGTLIPPPAACSGPVQQGWFPEHAVQPVSAAACSEAHGPDMRNQEIAELVAALSRAESAEAALRAERAAARADIQEFEAAVAQSQAAAAQSTQTLSEDNRSLAGAQCRHTHLRARVKAAAGESQRLRAALQQAGATGTTEAITALSGNSRAMRNRTLDSDAEAPSERFG